MKLGYLFVSASVVLGLASLACSSGDDDINMGSDGGSGTAGTKAQAGSDTGTAGDKPTGGSSNGGSASGGKTSGGDASGGVSTGGGGASGGVSTVGGDASGGSLSLGGEPGGGTCDQDTDCVACEYPTAPTSAQECYCIGYCSPPPMSKATCSANQAEFEKTCANVVLPCPAIKCLPPPQPVCSNHMCVAK